MKNNVWNKSVALLLSLVLIGIPTKKVQAYTSNPPSAVTGSALDGASNNCTKSGCHGGSWTTGSSVITVGGLPASWLPNTTYSLTVAVTGSSPYGFEITAENASAKVGTFTAGTGSAILDGSAKHFVGQTSSRSSWSISYLTPAAGAGTINFYVAATAKKSNNFQRIYSVPEGSSTPPPTISSQPSNQTVSEGATATFSVTATGSGSLSYQWQKAPAGSGTFANISAATSSSYTTPATVLADSTSQYKCIVTDSNGSTTSSAASLTVTAVPPTITSHPSNTTVTSGATASFSVSASGSATLSYQWQKAAAGSSTFANISAATSSSYTTPATVVADSTSQYRCVVTNTAGSATSNAATLTVNAVAPTISSQPNGQTVSEGATASFSVTASGSSPFTYQWQKAPAGSGVFANISAATSSSYTTPATVLADSTSQFRCVVTNAAGSATSNAATLTVNAAPPTITSHPSASSVVVTQTATFSVSASGSSTLNYQWQSAPSGSSTFSNVSGATSASYTTPATVIGDNGTQFKCVVTNTAGSATSNVATLTVTASAVAPTVSSHPSNLTVSEGATATFSVSATGSTPFTYQWQKAPAGSSTFANISAATSASYTTPATVLADSTSKYKCVITNSAGSATSNSATLTVNAVAPSIATQPTDQTVTVGATATFTVSASGSATLSYQWQKAPAGSSTFANISAATSASYTTPATSLTDDTAQYKCVVTNTAGSATSNAAVLNVNATPPAISTNPSNKTVSEGATATFTVSATGSGPLTYQWQKAASGSSTFSNISGATSSSYTTPATTVADSGAQYLCIVSNSAGLATSTSATLTVNAVVSAPTITTQPTNQTAVVGYTATFSVSATGTAPLTYQWKKAPAGSSTFANISAATNSSYTTPATTLPDSTSKFICVITNSVGSITSSTVTLTVAPPSAPTITDQPVDTYVLEGSTVTFSVVADSGGVDPLTYKWFKNSSQIIGEVSPDLTVDNVTTANNGDVFMCIVTNAANLSTTSNAATLKVGATPVVAAPQLTQVTTVGATDTLSLSNRYLNLKELQWTFTPVSTISNAQSVLGMSVAQATTTGYSINLATLNLAPGIYQVSVVAVVSGGSTSTATTMTITVIPGELNTVSVSPNPWVKLKNSQSPMTFANLSPGSVVKIYTTKGELIQTLYPTLDTASWNIKNDDGQWVASGTYYYVITDSKGHSHKSKIVVIR